MGVVWVWDLGTPEARRISAADADWKKTSRQNVDAVISRGRNVKGTEIAPKETYCPECSYIIRSASFPAQCAYCGSSL